MIYIRFGIPDLADSERSFLTFSKSLDRNIQVGIEKSAAHATQEIKNRTPVAFGVLKRGIGYDVTHAKNQSVATISAPGVDYAAAVEHGSKPHFPPVSAIKRWVIQKLHVDFRKAGSVAFAICKKIAKFGTKPNNMFRDGVDASIPKIKQIMRDAIHDALRDFQIKK